MIQPAHGPYEQMQRERTARQRTHRTKTLIEWLLIAAMMTLAAWVIARGG